MVELEAENSCNTVAVAGASDSPVEAEVDRMAADKGIEGAKRDLTVLVELGFHQVMHVCYGRWKSVRHLEVSCK